MRESAALCLVLFGFLLGCVDDVGTTGTTIDGTGSETQGDGDADAGETATADVGDGDGDGDGDGLIGCSDGEREGFVDIDTYPNIAGCSGGWSLPGVIDTFMPACGRVSGDDSNNPSGQGCNVADLCEVGWHVCTGAIDVDANAPAGCMGATQQPDPMLFFAQRQSGPGVAMCGSGADDVFGCGNHGDMPDANSCMPLDRSSGGLCAAIGVPWMCGIDGPSDGNTEAANVTKASSDVGGVLCCRD